MFNVLRRLQEENDFLVGKHSLHAEQLQNEMINLPDNLQELQYVCLNLREDFIAAKVYTFTKEMVLVYVTDTIHRNRWQKKR